MSPKLPNSPKKGTNGNDTDKDDFDFLTSFSI